MEFATQAHEQGNSAFRAGNLESALFFYTSVITALNSAARSADVGVGSALAEQLLRSASKTFCNRAAVHLKLGQLADADGDASSTLAILLAVAVGEKDDEILHSKAYLRRCSAREQCGRPKLALEDATAAAVLLRRRAASHTASRLVGDEVAAADAGGNALLRSALAARHRLQQSLPSADADEDKQVGIGADGPGADADHSGELLHRAHTLRLFMREGPPGTVAAAEWFRMSFYLGNEFGLFRPQEEPFSLALELSMHSGAARTTPAWQVEVRTAAPLLALAERCRVGGARNAFVAVVPGHGKVELEARVVRNPLAGRERELGSAPPASLHISAVPYALSTEEQQQAPAPIAVMPVSTLLIAIIEPGSLCPAPVVALHEKAAALGVTSCREVPFGSHDILVAEAPGQLGIGGKVWDAAVALLSHLAPQHGADGGTSLVHGKRCLELGAGTGLVGLSCALLGASSVVLTDMVDVVPLLTLNAALNTQLLDDVAGGSSAGARAVSAAEMLWGCPAHVEAHDAFELVVMADCVYDPAGYEPLLQTLNFLCDRVDPASPPLLIVLAHRHRHPEDWRFFEKLDVQFSMVVTAQVSLAGRGDAGHGKWGHDVKIMHITRKDVGRNTCGRK